MGRTRRPRHREPKVDVHLLASLYGFEVCLVLLVLSLRRLGGRPLFSPSVPSLALLTSIALGCLSTMVIVDRYRTRHSSGPRSLHLTMGLNVFSVLLILLTAELTIRMLSASEGDMKLVLNTQLHPRKWSEVVQRYEQVIEKMSTGAGYIVPDAYLGWTPGANRTSENGLYCTSAEGLRSPRPGISLLGKEKSHRDSETVRIALVGDSYTFCEDATFEESWGSQLDDFLGPGYRVLNFGVPGYGIDQAYLRYCRDVLPWKPDFIVFGFIDHDLFRSLTVYKFIASPGWDYPFSKPRFIFEGQQLQVLNQPALSPANIFSKSSITELPFLQYEAGFDPNDWQVSFYHRSDLIRFLASRSAPPATERASDWSMDKLKLGGEILRMFLRVAKSQQALPVLVYFPNATIVEKSFGGTRVGREPGRDLLHAIAEESQTIHVDMFDHFRKMKQIPMRSVRDRRIHYSPQANRAVARQLHELILTLPPKQPTNRITPAPQRSSL